MNIVFIGAVKFSKSCLEKLIEINFPPVAVCTLEISKSNADHSDLTNLCNENNIPVKYTSDINSKESYFWIQSYAPDIIFCFGWSRLIKEELLNLPHLGVIGYHPAPLPKNRGRHPLIWSLVLGLDKTASTFFFMDSGADSGDILSQKEVLINLKDNAESLYKKITHVALKQLEEFVPSLGVGDFTRIAQENNNSNTWRKRNEEDGRIDWRMSAESIQNLVRGLSHPYVGAHFNFFEKKIIVWKTKLVYNSKKNIEPGKIISLDIDGPIIMTGENAIQLLEIEPLLDLTEGNYL